MASNNYGELRKLKIAVSHYWFVTWRGGEKVVRSILDLFPNAEIYTLFYDKEICGPHLKGLPIHTSSLNLPFLKKHYQKLFPFYPMGIESIKIKEDYDLIISSESGPAKGIQNPKNIPHLCYIHSPMRYCWGGTDVYLEAMPSWMRGLAKRQFEQLRKWDETTINMVDHYIANSKNIQERVKKYYKRDSSICHPPIELKLFEKPLSHNNKKYFLSFGAITPYKKIDLLVESFRHLKNETLLVIGDGSEKKKLETTAPKNVHFLGAQSWDKIEEFIRNSKALIFPGEEDFGMIPLEVMAFGVPVIAFKKGGALETVIQSLENPRESTGVFFEKQNVESLKLAVETFFELEQDFAPQFIRSHARTFGEDHFKQKFLAEVSKFLS